MGFQIYDYRTDIRNVLVTSQTRSRFVKKEPGPMPKPHSHDLGQEVFLILQGKAEVEIEGETQVLEAGQMCVALANQLHAIRAVGPGPMFMYLSVSPHIQPTHTKWDEHGNRQPHRFVGRESYDATIDRSVPNARVVDSYVEALGATAAAAQAAAAETEVASRIKAAMDEGDSARMEESRGLLWDSAASVYERVAEMADIWNDLAARTVEPRPLGQ